MEGAVALAWIIVFGAGKATPDQVAIQYVLILVRVLCLDGPFLTIINRLPDRSLESPAIHRGGGTK